MKLAWILLVAFALPCYGLTSKEREIVLHAKSQLELAQKQLQDSQNYAEWADRSQADAWIYAGQTDVLAKQAKADVDAAYEREKAIAAERDKMKPVYDEVTRWFGIGAIFYGIKQLLKNLLILGIVVAALSGVIYGLSFAFPIFGIAWKFIVGVVKKILRR